MMEWTEITEDHLPAVEEAFAGLRDRLREKQVSYLAEPGIADFHRDRISDRIVAAIGKSSPAQPLYGVITDGKLDALASVAGSKWHTEHFCVPFYKLQPYFLFVDDGDKIQSITASLQSMFFTEPGAVYTLRTDAADHAQAYLLPQHGFVHVGTSVRLEISGRALDEAVEAPLPGGVTVRGYQNGDLAALQRIIREGHEHSHFFQERRFAKERVEDLFAEWIKKCADGLAQQVLVIERDGETAGFCSLMLQDALQPYIGKRIGVMDFIVIGKNAQGKGTGRLLLNHALCWLRQRSDLVELRTMADNLRAVRFYEANGFRLLSSDQYYHYWT